MQTTENTRTALPIDALEARKSYAGLHRGDLIGYVVTVAGFVQSWQRAKVIAYDQAANLLVVRCADGRIDTLLDGTDEVIDWPADQDDRAAMPRYVPVVVAGNSTVHAGHKIGTYASGRDRFAKLCAANGRANHEPMTTGGSLRDVTCRRCIAKLAERA